MLRIILTLIVSGFVTAASAQTPLTTKPNLINMMVTPCAANVLVLGNGSGASPLCGPTLPTAAIPAFAGGDVTGAGASQVLSIVANAVTNAKLATMTANTVKANATGGPATPTDVGPATARSSSLLNVDSFTGHGDSNYTILATDRTVGTNAAFTASRTWTLPPANAVNSGQETVVADFQGTVTGVNTLVVARAGSDTINGGTTATISAANGGLLLRSDGVSKWTAQAFTAGTGLSSLTCNNGLDGGTITTSGTCSLSAARRTGQTNQKFVGASLSGTYTTPANVTSIDLVLVGPGGGGEGSGTSHGNGGAGGNTCWNTSGAACTSPISAAGGGSGSNSTSGGAGGTTSGSCDMSFPGGQGMGSAGAATAAGSGGGNGVFGGGGAGGPPGTGGVAGAAGTGGGGGGAASNGTAGNGAGGGSGAYCAVHISSPAATYTYATGAVGTAGTAGTGGTAGGAGGSGGIWVRENYNIN